MPDWEVDGLCKATYCVGIKNLIDTRIGSCDCNLETKAEEGRPHAKDRGHRAQHATRVLGGRKLVETYNARVSLDRFHLTTSSRFWLVKNKEPFMISNSGQEEQLTNLLSRVQGGH